MNYQDMLQDRIHEVVSPREGNPYWLSDPVMRHLMYGHAFVTGRPVLSYSKQSFKRWISQLHSLNASMDFPVKVAGNLNTLTLDDWMTIEREIVKAWLQQSRHIAVSANFLKDSLATHSSHLPAILNNTPRLLAAKPETILWGVVGTCVLAVGAMHPEASMLTSALAGLGGIVVWGRVYAGLNRRINHEEQMTASAIVSCSPTWDQVFQSKTLPDSLLVGMLTEFVLSHADGNDNPQHTPQLLSISPTSAFEALTKIYSNDGSFYHLTTFHSACNRYIQSLKGSSNAHVVAGLDLSGMVEPASHADHLDEVHLVPLTEPAFHSESAPTVR